MSFGIHHSSIPQSYNRPESESVKKLSEAEKKTKLYSEEGPSKMLRRSTSLNVNKDKFHDWIHYGRLHCDTLPRWSSDPPSFNSTPNWHAPFAFLIPVIGAIAQMNFPNSSPLEEHPASIWIFIVSLLIYCFAFGSYTKFQIYSPAIALISGSLAYAALISLLVPRFLQPLVFIAWTEDFVIDTLELRIYVGPYLRIFFKHPTRRKASRVLKLERNSLEYLLHHYCGVTADKHYQIADWRLRPLPDEMLRYAREDTHYLLNLSFLYISQSKWHDAEACLSMSKGHLTLFCHRI
ncbi:hypothetical protein K1719_001254 [Acacia pycnantha]|nr:hypothetical protein K1719_001254 [Acacia pycnantha]